MMKQILTFLLTCIIGLQVNAQYTRIRLNQIQKDTIFGSVLISSPTDSNMVYSRNFFITNDSILRFYNDTIPTKSYVDSVDATKIDSVFVDNIYLTGNGLIETPITFNQSTLIDSIATVVEQGMGIRYNVDEGTYETDVNGNTILHIGQDVVYRVKNQTGVTIPAKTLVAFNGTTGNSGLILITPFIADGTIPSRYVLGIVNQDIEHDSLGYAWHFGKIKPLVTNSNLANTETWSNGDILWADPNYAGGLTKTEPEAPNLKLAVAAVVSATSPAGELFVRVETGTSLFDDNDVQLDTANLFNQSMLVYDSIQRRWENSLITLTQLALKDYVDSIANVKQNTITGAATTITNDNLTTNRVLISDTNGKVAASSLIDTTELGYLNNVTSNIQTQLNTKFDSTQVISLVNDTAANIRNAIPIIISDSLVYYVSDTELNDSLALYTTKVQLNDSLSFYVSKTLLNDSLSNKLNTSFSNVTGTLPVANGGTGVSSLTANKVLVGNGTGTVLTPTNLHWDNTNSRLGIGITAPRVALEVNADQIIDASNVWTARTSAADNNWFGVTYGNGLFVAVAGSGSGNRVMTSPDGITWTARTSAADNDWRSVTYGNGLFVAVAGSGSGNRVMTSPDGITWTARTSAADNSWLSVTYGNGLFVAVAGSGSGNRVMTSPDGITWTARTSAANNNWFGVTYGNGLFVAVAVTGSGNRVMTSPDGITWTARTSEADNSWRSVTYGNGLFVAVAGSGSGNRVMTSPDGITWTARTSAADNDWRSVTYGNGLFVAVAGSGSGNRVMTSPDGITWTARTSAADNDWRSVTYGNGLFVAVAGTGSGNRVMTSGKQYKQDLAHNNIWQGNQYMPFVYNQTTAEAANMYIDTTTGELKRSTSSIRYKTDVELYQKGLNDLLNLTPVTFKGINDGNKTFAGFIAEEIESLGLFEFVQYGADGRADGIAYAQMTSLITKAIQEQQAIINQQQTQITTLENTINQLIQRIELLENK
jgi:hypothetical protein